jgi:hypothetical protein
MLLAGLCAERDPCRLRGRYSQKYGQQTFAWLGSAQVLYMDTVNVRGNLLSGLGAHSCRAW